MADDRSMVDVMRGSRILAYSMGLLCLVFGLFLIFRLEESIGVIAKVIGVVTAVVGVAGIFEAVTTHRSGSAWGLLLVRGIVNLVVGVLLIGWPEPTVLVIVWVMGLDLVLTGAVGMAASFRVDKDLGRGALQFRSGVAIVFGLMIMVWPDITVGVVGLIVGIQLVLAGLLLLVSGYQLTRAGRSG